MIMPESGNASASAIAITNARFRWRQHDAWTLDIPALHVAAGERVFLAGPSGSGKSTLLNLIGGLLIPESGEVRVLGETVSALSGARRDSFRADHIGFVFQMFNLVPYLSILENVLLPCRFSVRRREAAASAGSPMAEATRLLAQMGLTSPALIGRPVTDLSVGQQQRVAAARALIGGPQIVIADEPTSALDADAQSAFLDLMFEEVARTGAALLFVSHDRRLEDGFDRAVALQTVNRAEEQVSC